MTVEPAPAGLTEQRLLAELTGMLLEVTGEDDRWAAGVMPASRLEGDLRLESVELATLAALVRDRHGDRVDLVSYVCGLDIDQIIGLTVGDLVAYVAAAPPSMGHAGAGG
jgi:acyl carrier protein